MGLLLLTGVAFAVSRALGVSVFFGGGYFEDLTWFQSRFQRYGTAQFYANPPGDLIPWNLPDTMAVLYRLFYRQAHPLGVYIAVHAAIILLAGAVLFRVLRARNVRVMTALVFSATVVVTSSPLWFLLECANLEMFVVLATAAGIACYLRKRLWWAAAFFGIAAALKITPVLFFALLLNRRDSRKLLFGLGVAASVFLLGEWWVGPTVPIALHGMRASLAAYKARVILGMSPRGLSADHSLFTICKHLVFFARVTLGWQTVSLAKVYPFYLAVAGAGAALLYIKRIRHLPALNKAIAVTTLVLILPPISWDYRLLHLYPVWLFVLIYVLERKTEVPRSVETLLLLFAVLFTCHNFLYYRLGAGYGVSVSMAYGGQLETLVLIAMLIVSTRQPIEMGDPQSQVKQEALLYVSTREDQPTPFVNQT